jgi:hypothetical protein
LELGQADRTHYVVKDGLRVLAYERNGAKVRFFLDRAVYADCARRWLPMVGAYAVGMVDHLLRVRLAIQLEQGKVTIAASGISGTLAETPTLHVFAEDDAGGRKEIAQAPLRPGAEATLTLPPGARKVAAYVRGRDAGGAFVASVEASVP